MKFTCSFLIKKRQNYGPKKNKEADEEDYEINENEEQSEANILNKVNVQIGSFLFGIEL